MIRFETEMYDPVKKYFEKEGYVVRGEVNGCDLTAVYKDELIVVEMKTNFSLKLLYQAISRQKLTPYVFVAIPRPAKNDDNFKQKINLLKKLEIGLITVAADSAVKSVQIVMPPGNAKIGNPKKRKKMLDEINARSIDGNTGGSVRKKLLTAFREKSIHIACILQAKGELSPKQIKQLGADKNAGSILYNNFYGWFERVEKGIYTLSEKGIRELEDMQFKEIVSYYRKVLGEGSST